MKIYISILFTAISLSAGAQNIKDGNMKRDDLRSRLTDIQFYVTQQKGTERPFTGEYWNHFEPGLYVCVCCGAELFQSNTKFHSSCGWPSFFDSKFIDNLKFQKDFSHGMVRTEVLCKKCGAHLGHVFNDGPEPTGVRYCINSASLNFIPITKE